MADPTFEEITAALYAGSPEAFVASRKDRASECEDAELASRILVLRKPSIAAWVVNVFAQERAGQLGEALRLAAELREARDELDASALAKLGRERRALTRRLAETAAEIAGSRGERITPATREAVERSISAAFFDPLAASAVASGRLLRALEPTASATDIRDAVAGDIASFEATPQRPTDELQERRARREAERRLAAAEKDQVAAERELAKQETELQGLRDRAAELAEKAEELEAELTRTRVAASHVEQDIPEAQERQAIAAERVDDAVEATALARKALDAL